MRHAVVGEGVIQEKCVAPYERDANDQCFAVTLELCRVLQVRRTDE